MLEPARFTLVPDAALTLADWRDATVRVLRPFSWDAKLRGLTIETLPLAVQRTLVSGPYAAADAAALNVNDDVPFDFPDDDGTDMAWYRAVGEPATGDERYQDAAGWCTIEATGPSGPVALALALRESSTVLLDLGLDVNGLTVTARHSSGGGDVPSLLARVGPGDHADAEEWLRELIIATMPHDRLGPPPLMADTWGFGTDIDPSRVTDFFDAAEELGLEVVTIDKGWEASVGDWVADPSYVGGVPALAREAHARGLRLGLWVAAGNADPASVVAREHPDWLAQWRGKRLLLSHRTNVVCLGHEPAAAAVLAQLDALVMAGMNWLLHDFETIARCDASHHSHDSASGERASAAGWYRILGELRRRHPDLIVENCWNGGRPLDLPMIAHHDTTIGDDWCRSESNRVAKLGLGRYLPSSWASAYMGDEDMPVRSRLAPYLVGGPWILMGDIAGWDDDHRATVRTGLDIARRWRTADRHARVVDADTDAHIAGLATTPRADGSRLATFVVSPEDVGREVRWRVEAGVLCDEWSGERRRLTDAEVELGVLLDTSEPTGLALSIHPD